MRATSKSTQKNLLRLARQWHTCLSRSLAGVLTEIESKAEIKRNEIEMNGTKRDSDAKIDFDVAAKEMKRSRRTNYLKRVLSKKSKKSQNLKANEFKIENVKSMLADVAWLAKMQTKVLKKVEKIDDNAENAVKALNAVNADDAEIVRKMGKLLNKEYFAHTHWMDRIFMQSDVEAFSEAIIESTNYHASYSIALPRKQRALATLLTHLKSSGLSLSAPSDIAAANLEPAQLFQTEYMSLDAMREIILGDASGNGLKSMKWSEKYVKWFETLSAKCNQYFYQNVRNICQLRMRRLAPHKDVINVSGRCYGATENLMRCIASQREFLSQLLLQIATLKQWKLNLTNVIKNQNSLSSNSSVSDVRGDELFYSVCNGLKGVGQCASMLEICYDKVLQMCKSKKKSKSGVEYNSDVFDSEDLANFEDSIPDFIKYDENLNQQLVNSKDALRTQYSSHLNSVKQIRKQLQQLVTRFNIIKAQKIGVKQDCYRLLGSDYYIPYWSHSCESELLAIDSKMREIGAKLAKLPFSQSLKHSQVLPQLLETSENEVNPSQAPSSEWIQVFEEQYANCRKAMQLCVQDALKAANDANFVQIERDAVGRDGEQILWPSTNNYIKLQHESVSKTIQMFRGLDICSHLCHITRSLNKLSSCMPSDAICLKLEQLESMLGSMIDVGVFVFNHNLWTHKSFCKLNYVLIALFKDLFVKGFCRPDTKDADGQEAGDDGDQDGQGQDGGVSEGTGMGDGTGLQDVSNEMENESQVEGLQDARNKQEKQEKPDKDENAPQEKKQGDEENEDEGVDMSNTDFEGDLFDLEPENKENQHNKDKNKNDDSGDESGDDDDMDREMAHPGNEFDFDVNQSDALDQQLWAPSDSEDDENETDRNKHDDPRTAEKNEETSGKDEINDMKDSKKERNNDTSVNSKDAQVEMEAKLDEMMGNDENEEDAAQADDAAKEEKKNNRDGKDGKEDAMEQKDDKEKREMKLEFSDEVSDLDDDVSDDAAAPVAQDGDESDGSDDMDRRNGDKSGMDENELQLPDSMKIDLGDGEMSDQSDGDDAEKDGKDGKEGQDGNESGDDDMGLNELENDLKEQERAQQEERMDDLNRGNGEIMKPPTKDNELEFLEDSELDDDANDADDEFGDAGQDGNDSGQDDETFDLDKKLAAAPDDADDVDESGAESDVDMEGDGKDENKENDNNNDMGDSNDVLRPDMPKIENEDENNADEQTDGSDNEMTGEEKDDNNVENVENDEENKYSSSMGVRGGQGDIAPVGKNDGAGDESDDDIDMKNDQDSPNRPPNADDSAKIENDDDEQKNQENTMVSEQDEQAQWQPISMPEQQQQQQQKQQKKGKQKQKKQQMDENTDQNENGQEPDAQDEQASVNPFRNLGDALSEWKKNLNLIEQKRDEKQQDQSQQPEVNDVDAADEGQDEKDANNNNNEQVADNYAKIEDESLEIENATNALADAEDANEQDLASLAQKLAEIYQNSNEFDENDDALDAMDSSLDSNSELEDSDIDMDAAYDPKSKPVPTKSKPDQSDAKNERKDAHNEDQNEMEIEVEQKDNNEMAEIAQQQQIENLRRVQELLQQNRQSDALEQAEAKVETSILDAKNSQDDENEDATDEKQERDDSDSVTSENKGDLDDMDEMDVAFDDAEFGQNNDLNALGAEVWHQLSLETNGLSQQLCEELRSVLEPLQKSKLGGDFKSGKRINIRKVIPYIASHFRKDKIWLKRCVPHKRNYQILIAIDDSESMRENNCNLMALESLCIIAQALAKLEVGKIGVVSFGNEVKLLHGLDTPFSAQSGGHVVAQFGFRQRQTDYSRLLANCINVLSEGEAKYSLNVGGGESLSLVFVISDGRVQQDRVRLEQLVRVAQEKKQVVLMIIIDNDAQENRNGNGNGKQRNRQSIVNIESIEFDKETGKVKTKNYFDDYPFAHYIVLNDTKILPNVVADALRQWFEMIRQSSGLN